MESFDADRAIIELSKLRDYCLNPQHPRGKHKARMFNRVLGLTREDAQWLAERLREALRRQSPKPGKSDRFGQRYVIDFIAETESGEAKVRSAWIVKTEESFPRFVTCYVLGEDS